MHFINFFILILTTLCLSVRLIDALEYCGLLKCPDYCCKSFDYYCCSECNVNSIYYNDCYYSRFSTPSIIGGIFSSLIFIIVVSLIISICCGCICSSRTGIQRRGFILRTQQPSVTVMNSNAIPDYQAAYPPYAVVYPPGQAPYPQGQLPFPPAYPGINPYKQETVSPYSANQNQESPPSYNFGFVPDHR